MSGDRKKDRNIYVAGHNITSPLGNTTLANFDALKAGRTEVKKHTDLQVSPEPFVASLFDRSETFLEAAPADLTRFESLAAASVQDALNRSGKDARDNRTIFILSSTKGNISLLETSANTPALQKRVSLNTSANIIAGHFGFQNKPVVVSNACISGVLALVTAMRLIRSGEYDTAVVTGADVISKFIVSGFQSFQALSDEVCRPFDRQRKGLNLGEGAGTIILSASEQFSGNVKILGGAISNDANHISGPSRTGEELAGAISHALKDAKMEIPDVGFISAHGTATPYNDEMEAKALTLAGFKDTPLNSLKGYYGHTLGAAGLIETVVSLATITEGLLIPTPGYTESGVSTPVNVCRETTVTNARTFLKTASGFGGCNGAVIFGK